MTVFTEGKSTKTKEGAGGRGQLMEGGEGEK